MTKKATALVLLIAISLAACASQPPPDVDGNPGFFSGLWNGFTVLFSLLAGVFSHHRIYAFPNSGWWYDFGFFIGFGTWGGALDAIAKAIREGLK